MMMLHMRSNACFARIGLGLDGNLHQEVSVALRVGICVTALCAMQEAIAKPRAAACILLIIN